LGAPQCSFINLKSSRLFKSETTWPFQVFQALAEETSCVGEVGPEGLVVGRGPGI